MKNLNKINNLPPPPPPPPPLDFLINISLCFAFALILSGEQVLAQSGTNPLPPNVRQRGDGSIDFVPRFNQSVNVQAQDTASSPEGSRQTAEAPLANERTCQQKLSHCDPEDMRRADVCIVQSNLNYRNVGGYLRKVETPQRVNVADHESLIYACPQDTRRMQRNNIVLVRNVVTDNTNIDQLLQQLDQVADRCLKIRGLYIRGNGGSAGVTGVGLNRDNVDRLKEYSCLIEENAKIELYASYTGRDCSGQVFMQQVAENLLQGKPGRIKAPRGNLNVNFGGGRGITVTNQERRQERLEYSQPYFTVPYGPSGDYSRGGFSELEYRSPGEYQFNFVEAGKQAPPLTMVCANEIGNELQSINKRQRDLTDGRGTECPKLNQCRGVPYRDVRNRARDFVQFRRHSDGGFTAVASVPGRRRSQEHRDWARQASRFQDQLLTISGVLSQCNNDTPHTGCDWNAFISSGTTGTTDGSATGNR